MPSPSRRDFVRSLGAGAAAVTAACTPPVFTAGRTFPAAPQQGLEGDVHLNFNESPYGPSPRALAAIRGAQVELASRYFPEDTYDSLCEALARHHGVTRKHVRVTVGSTELLKVCDDVFLGGRRSLVVAEPAYEAVLQYAANSKADAQKVSLTDDHRHDLARMGAATHGGTGLVYICNPNNPTGTIVPRDAMTAFMRRVPASVTVLVDEAYAEFADSPEFESAVRFVHEGRNVIVAKTFSKVHGMAGMRVGYAIAKPDLIDRISPFTVDFALSGPTAAAALASVRDPEHLAMVVRENAVQRSRFFSEMKRLGFACAESQANFAMVDLRRPVVPVIGSLKKRRVLVGREFAAMPNFLRVTLGTAKEMDAFYAAFGDVVGA